MANSDTNSKTITKLNKKFNKKHVAKLHETVASSPFKDMFVELTLKDNKYYDKNGDEVTYRDYPWTYNKLHEVFGLNSSFVLTHMRKSLHYIYFSPIYSEMAARYFLDDPDAVKRNDVKYLYFSNRDVYEWLKKNTIIGKKATHVSFDKLFKRDDRDKILEILIKYFDTAVKERDINELRETLKKYVKPESLNLLEKCLVMRDFNTYNTGRFKFTRKAWNLSYDEFNEVFFVKSKLYKHSGQFMQYQITETPYLMQFSERKLVGYSDPEDVFLSEDTLEKAVKYYNADLHMNMRVSRVASAISNLFLVPAQELD